MSEYVNFIQGSKENYNPSEMQGGLFFSKDTKEILLNGEEYGRDPKWAALDSINNAILTSDNKALVTQEDQIMVTRSDVQEIAGVQIKQLPSKDSLTGDEALVIQDVEGNKQTLVKNIIEKLNSQGYLFAGVATPSTNPGTPDGNVFYLTNETGVYSNFGGAELTFGNIGIFKNNSAGVWTLTTLPLADIISEVNVSKIYPTGGIDGTNKYTLETAIAIIPESLRNVGLKCSFLNEEGELETWEYQGGTFTGSGTWKQMGAKSLESLRTEIGTQLNKKANKTDLPFSETEEEGAYFANEKGEVFARFDDEGFDVSKVSQDFADKVKPLLGEQETTRETEEDGAYLANEKGEVFARYRNGKFEASGLQSGGGGGGSVSKLEDIENVTGGTANQFLQKQPNGNWAGASVVIPEKSLNELKDVAVSPSEGDILQYKSGKWVNASISLEGLVTTDSRALHPLYGKHIFVLGDSHKDFASFFPYLAEITGSTYHTSQEKVVDNETHFFIDNQDVGVSKLAYPYDWAAYIQHIYDAGKTIDYLIIENCHLGSEQNWENMETLFPFSGYERIEYPDFNSQEEYLETVTSANWGNIISKLQITDIKKAIRFRYLTAASQTISFSFSSGDTLTEDTVVSIIIGSGTKMDTSLTAGMTLEECVYAINDWAFQENSDWINADKGTHGLTKITLTYSGDGDGDPTAQAQISQSIQSNLVFDVEFTSTYTQIYRVYKLPDTSGLNDISNWVAHGSSAIGWFYPQPFMGAMYLLGKYFPNAKAVFCGIDSYNTSQEDSIFADGTINAEAIYSSKSYNDAKLSKLLTKKFAETFNYQYIDIGALCGITPYNMYPTFYNYNNVHMKEAGYHRWAECIANYIK